MLRCSYAAGLKLAKEGGVTADNLKAATFIVLNPNATFGITSLDAAKGEVSVSLP